MAGAYQTVELKTCVGRAGEEETDGRGPDATQKDRKTSRINIVIH